MGLPAKPAACLLNAGVRSKSPRSSLLFIFLGLLSVLAHPEARAAEGRAYLEAAGRYRTGDFGTATRTSLYYLASVLGYVAPRYAVSVTAPYLYLTRETGSVRTTETGIGDIILQGERVFLPVTKGGLSVDGSLAVKIPTADETKGLGTGETDYGAFAGLHQRVKTIRLSLTGGYIKVGDPPSINFNDIYLYGIGMSKVFGRTNVSASLEGRRSAVPGVGNPREIHVESFHVLNAHYSLDAETFVGLTDGGPDFGLSLGVVRWF
jgi:hypothetical protein